MTKSGSSRARRSKRSPLSPITNLSPAPTSSKSVVAVSKGALDVLMEARWVRMRGRRKAPGRPITYGTTTEFLVEFGLNAIADLPGLDELKGAGLFDGKLPAGYDVPQPDDGSTLRADEDPLEDPRPSSKLGASPPEEG